MMLPSLKLWDEQGCLEKFALGNSRESLDFPEGRSPEGKSDDVMEFQWANFSDNPEDFPLFFRLLDYKSEDYGAQTYPRVNTEHIPVLLHQSLESVNPDFTVVNRKSGDSHPLHDREKQGLAAAGGAVGRSRLLGKCG